MADFYDIDFSFGLDAKGDIKMVSDADAIKQSVESTIYTALGSRAGVGFVNTQYGLGINRYLFTNMTQYTAQKLSENIHRQLTTFEPRIKLTNVHVNADLAEQQYDITIIFSYKETTKQETFNLVIRQL